jgi:hypothetical protein
LQKSVNIDVSCLSINIHQPHIAGTNFTQPVGVSVNSTCVDFKGNALSARCWGATTIFSGAGTNGTIIIDGENRSDKWDKEPMRMGDYRLWVDAAGKLRIKDGAPTSDTDGAIVGTQS